MKEQFRQIGFEQLNGWEDDDHLAAMDVFLKTARRMLEEPYPTKDLGLSSSALVEVSKRAIAQFPFNASSAKSFFEDNFEPCEIADKASDNSGNMGFVTAYYEPEVVASRTKTSEFSAPLYLRPDDLIDITDDNRPDGFDKEFRFARHIEGDQGGKTAEYPDRQVINAGLLENQGLEIAWVKDLIEALFIHIQGSARLKLDNGEYIRVGYAAKTGHPYTAVGKILLDRGELTRENCGMQAIREWFSQNPDQISSVIAHNRSYIFFNEYAVTAESSGPIGAAKVNLTPLRSLAVDRNLHTYGTPVWIEASKPLPGETLQFKKLMIAQDTGSAIIGSMRGDLFLGSGDAAGKMAGDTRHQARFVVFVPRVRTH